MLILKIFNVIFTSNMNSIFFIKLWLALNRFSMKDFKQFILVIVGLLFFNQCINAIEVIKLGMQDGLSNNNVISIAQDKDGYVWIATKDGLNRYDGNAFNVYKYSDTDENSLTSNVLNCVFPDPNDNIVWIATEKNGLVEYNYVTKQFKRYTHDPYNKLSLITDGITHITNDKKGNLWLATYQAGIDYFDKESGTFTHYNQSNIRGLGSDYNWYIMSDNDERLYVGHVNEGLSIISLKTQTAINLKHDPFDPNSLPNNTVTCIYKDNQDHIWIGTRDGLALFDPTSLKMKNIWNIPEKPQSLSANFIKSLVETEDSMLWIGTEGGGINILDLKSFSTDTDPNQIKFKHIKNSETSDGLSSLSVQSLLLDSYGNFWAGGYIGGLNIIPNKESFFKQIKYLPLLGNQNSLNDKLVTGICTDQDNNVWVANSQGGVCVYNDNKKVKNITSFKNKTLNTSSVYTDYQNITWIGTSIGEIYKYDPNKDLLTKINGLNQIKNYPIYYNFVDSRNNLWICTDIGLGKYIIDDDSFVFYTIKNSELSDNVIRAVAEDKDGNIWVGTLIGGLSVFDQNFKSISNYGRYYDFYGVNHIYKDSQNRMWVASQNDLFLFNTKGSNTAQRIGIQEGLPTRVTRSVMEGKTSNEFWVSTTNGISQLLLDSMEIKNFYMSDGISMGDYLPNSIARTTDGTIYFGTQNGITYFNPFDQDKKIPQPQVTITNFSIPVNLKNQLNEFASIPFDKMVMLKPDQNTFRLNFSVLDFSLSDDVEFMFQMQGLDDQWYFIKNDKQVTFRNLAPGSYKFNIKTRIHDKEWSQNSASLMIDIAPPMWLTWQAKLTYVLSIILIIFLIIRFYKNKVRIENALILEKNTRQHEQDLHEDKIKFFTNITHELRTPMTLLLGPLEDLILENNFSPEQTKKINSMHRVANRLLQLINQILEFRKTESNNRELIVKRGDIVRYIYEIGLKYRELNTNKNIEFTIELPHEKMEMLFDSEVVSIILDNLLSNAFKYTKQGEVHLQLRRYEEKGVSYTEVEVNDTGLGIPESDVTYIFQRYFQVKNKTHTAGGTGIGLAIVKNLVELHQAEITVESEIDKGTSFKVRFLSNNTYPGIKHTHTPDEEIEDAELLDDTKEVILIVDDNEEIIEYIYDSLIDTYHVIKAKDGQEGYNIACEKIPDIIISDIMMPVMDGIEMCKALKKEMSTCHIPIVLLTAKGSIQDKSEGYSAGADSYLTKPFSSTLLKSRLKNIVDTRKTLSTSYNKIFKDKKQFFKEATNQLDKEFLEKLTEVIEGNLEEEEMNISQIASNMNMSHSTLYRKIKALTDLTANEFIRKVRMRVAEELILSNEYNISEIMYKIGINSKSYFRQCFKDEFGVAPTDYIKKLQE